MTPLRALPQALHCAACGHEWASALRLPMALDRVIGALEGIVAAGCPSCGAGGLSVLCGPVPRPASTAVSAPGPLGREVGGR